MTLFVPKRQTSKNSHCFLHIKFVAIYTTQHYTSDQRICSRHYLGSLVNRVNNMAQSNHLSRLDNRLKERYKENIDWTLLPQEFKEVSPIVQS